MTEIVTSDYSAVQCKLVRYCLIGGRKKCSFQAQVIAFYVSFLFVIVFFSRTADQCSEKGRILVVIVGAVL